MPDIPFGKFFDSQSDHGLMTSLELVVSKELNYPAGDMAYLLKSSLTKDYYVVVEAEHGADWSQINDWAQEVLENQSLKLEEVSPKNPNTYAEPYYLFRVNLGE